MGEGESLKQKAKAKSQRQEVKSKLRIGAVRIKGVEARSFSGRIFRFCPYFSWHNYHYERPDPIRLHYIYRLKHFLLLAFAFSRTGIPA